VWATDSEAEAAQDPIEAATRIAQGETIPGHSVDMSSREQHHKTSEGIPPGGRPPNAQQQALLEGLALEMEEMIDKLFARSEEVGLCNHPLSRTVCYACKAAHPGGGGGRRFRRRCTRRWRAGICPVMIHGSRCHPCGSLTRRKSDSASCSATWHSSVAGRLELRRSSRSSPLHKPLAPVPPECCSAVISLCGIGRYPNRHRESRVLRGSAGRA
jgi:hypothetical protein